MTETAAATLISLSPVPLQAVELERAHIVRPPVPLPAQLVACADPQSVGAEQFRRLAVSLSHTRAQRRLHTVLVSSAAPGEGKTINAANLALTLARPGRERVLLLEGDLHRPALLARMGVQAERGLGDWLEQRLPLGQCLLRWSGLPLWILPAGRRRSLPLELLQTWSPACILELLTPHFDWIIVDSPPLLPMADASHWARATDGVILTVRAERTRLADLQLAVRQIEREQWLGVVLNDCSAREHRYYRHYYPEDPGKGKAGQ
ncbi:MAG: CpsD/CapB family tyrosine-protein kinase [Terriglobales bacterium]